MIDIDTKSGAHAVDRLRNELVLWLTTVDHPVEIRIRPTRVRAW